MNRPISALILAACAATAISLTALHVRTISDLPRGPDFETPISIRNGRISAGPMKCIGAPCDDSDAACPPDRPIGWRVHEVPPVMMIHGCISPPAFLCPGDQAKKCLRIVGKSCLNFQPHRVETICLTGDEDRAARSAADAQSEILP